MNCGIGEQHKYGDLKLYPYEEKLYVCKSQEYAKKGQVLYSELRETLLQRGATPIHDPFTSFKYKRTPELSCGSSFCSGFWKLVDGRTLGVTVLHNGLVDLSSMSELREMKIIN